METIYSKALDAYLRRTRITQMAFALLAGSSQTGVCQYANGQRFPSKRVARNIDIATEGAVPYALWQAAAVERLGIYD